MIELSEVADLLRRRGMRFIACVADDDEEVVLTVAASDCFELVDQLRRDPDIAADILLARVTIAAANNHDRVITLLWSQALSQRFVVECLVPSDVELPSVVALFDGAVVDTGVRAQGHAS